jgi:hypothetical protein
MLHFIGLSLLLLAGGCSIARLSASDAAEEVLSVLEDSIRAGGRATLVIHAPIRSYQRRPAPASVDILANMLQLPVAAPPARLPVCKWTTSAADSVGMAITVTQLDIVDDSALVSVLRTCRESPDQGRSRRFESEPTWILRRSGGRWTVSRTRMRVT